MKCLVFEQWQGGHYFNYLECIVPALARVCDEVVVAVTEAAASSDRFASQLGGLLQLPQVQLDHTVPTPDAKSAVAFRWQLGKNLAEAMRRNRPDYVFLPSADEQLLTLPLRSLVGNQFRRVPVEAVIHYPAYTGSVGQRARLVSGLQRLLLKTGVFERLNFVNFLQYEEAVSQGRSLVQRARVAGDPVPQGEKVERGVARRMLGLDEGGRYLGMVGELDQRKAVPATLAAFRQARLAPSDRLLLAGKLVQPYKSLIESEYADLLKQGRLLVIDRFLLDHELAAAFSALDVHCSVYRCFAGLSSLLLKSLAAGRPVIVAPGGWGAAVVRRFDAGFLVDPAEIHSYSKTMRKALSEAETYSETPAVERLLQFHTVENFVNGLLKNVAEHARKPVPTPTLEWSWVLEALDPQRRRLT